MKFINKIRGRFGWFTPKTYIENDILQYETVLDRDGNYAKIRVCSQFDYDNNLNIYNDVSYLIYVVSNSDEPVFKMIPSYEKWLYNKIKALQIILSNKNDIPEHILTAFKNNRNMRAEISNTALINGDNICEI